MIADALVIILKREMISFESAVAVFAGEQEIAPIVGKPIIARKSERYSGTLLSKIKNSLKKSNEQLVSISEFCNYTGLKSDEVLNLIG